MNLTVKTKKYMNAKKTKIKMTNVRVILLKFYDQLSDASEFEIVDKKNFYELSFRVRNERKKTIKNNDVVEFQKRFYTMKTSSKKKRHFQRRDENVDK